MASLEERVERLSKREQARWQPVWDQKILKFNQELLQLAKSLEAPPGDKTGSWQVRLLASRYRSWKAGRSMPALPPEDIRVYAPVVAALDEVYAAWWEYEKSLSMCDQTSDED